MNELWTLLASALVTCLLMPPVIRLLHAVRVMDVPNARSSHVLATPRGGGIAVMAGVMTGAVVAGSYAHLWLLVGLALAAATVGLVDDLRTLPALLRLVAQFVLAVVVVAVLVNVETPFDVAVAVMALIGVVGYINAFNFMDGINGISGVSGALAAAWYLHLGTSEPDASSLALGGAVLLGACVGFLPWNLPRAKVFLGDVGSYGLGLFIAGLALLAFSEGVPPMSAVAPLLIYGVDAGWTLARRVRRGASWREAHREHVYQRLCDVGLSHTAATGVVGMHTVLVCAVVLLLPTLAAVVAVAAVLGAYLGLPRVLRGRIQSPSTA